MKAIYEFDVMLLIRNAMGTLEVVHPHFFRQTVKDCAKEDWTIDIEMLRSCLGRLHAGAEPDTIFGEHLRSNVDRILKSLPVSSPDKL